MLPVRKVQNMMKKNAKDIFLINRTDEFLNEDIAPYAERLNWISNFSGSAGRAIIETTKAYLFVDGRYTLQAINQVDPSTFEIKHLRDYWSHIKCYADENKLISLDAKLHSVNEIEKMQTLFSDFSLDFIANPIDLYWDNKPSYPNSTAFHHDVKYAGKNSTIKIKEIQENLNVTPIDFYLLSSLDSIAWLLNIRGGDIKNIPVLCCYAIIPKQGKIELFINSNIIHLMKDLDNIINFHPLENIDEFIGTTDSTKVFGMDKNFISYHFKNLCIKNDILTYNFENPCLYPKAIKNVTELNGAKNANIRDGISIFKYLFWLKTKIKLDEMDELKAAEYLLTLRKNNKHYFSPSFDTISAFGPHSALPHYRVTKESNSSFKNNSIYLIDSGAQYIDGTTDITRTIIFGTPTDEQKDRFTRVLKGHISIAQATFEANTKGSQLDPLAREFLKEINCDYDHGTGHGIGSFLSVHEGPQRISKTPSQSEGFIKEGMILSNEPGYYKEGEYGIRIENLIICCIKNPNDPNILHFETISWAPIDKSLIEVSMMNNSELEWLNNYHQKVYEKLSPNLNHEEREWLKLITSSLQ
jgi:Xaa-Pro aminopeptidase